jgi:hypothetical protein
MPFHFHRSRRFDWPAFLGEIGNRPDKSPQNQTWTVSHSTSVPETTLHSAIVRSCHSQPAPFRFWFQERSFSTLESALWRLSEIGKPVILVRHHALIKK